MKQRDRSKTFKNSQAPAGDQSDGSIWELCLFAIFFVLVFTAAARADDSVSARDVAAVKSASTARTARTKFSSPRAKSKLVAQTAPGTTVTQNDSTTPTASNTNPAIDKSIRSKQQQAAPIPTNALPEGTVRAAISEPKVPGPRFQPSAKLLVETTGTVSDQESRSFGGWYQLSAGIKDTQTNIGLGLLAGYSREYSYQRDDNTDGDIDNPILALSKTYTNGVDFKSPIFDTIRIGLSGAAGASREARRRTFIGSLGPTASVSKSIRKFSIGLGGGYNRGFYKYDIRDDGTVNSPNQFIGSADLSYAVTSKLSFSASMLYTYALSFQNVGKSTELSALSVSYDLFKKMTVAAGVATQRGTLEADGYTNTVKFFDPNVAQAFLDLNFIF